MLKFPKIIKQMSALREIRGYAHYNFGNAFAFNILRIKFVSQTNFNLTIVDLFKFIFVTSEKQTEKNI